MASVIDYLQNFSSYILQKHATVFDYCLTDIMIVVSNLMLDLVVEGPHVRQTN